MTARRSGNTWPGNDQESIPDISMMPLPELSGSLLELPGISSATSLRIFLPSISAGARSSLSTYPDSVIPVQSLITFPASGNGPWQKCPFPYRDRYVEGSSGAAVFREKWKRQVVKYRVLMLI